MNVSQKNLTGYWRMGVWLWFMVLSGYLARAATLEVILSASSTDGQTFTQDDGYRLADGYVDPYVLKSEPGNWLMLVATTPNPARLPQKIYMAQSSDGLAWQVETNALITVPGGNALDPTAVDLGNGSYRVYYAGTPSTDPLSGFYLTSGVLQATSPSGWSFTPDTASFGIYGVSPEALVLGSNAVRIYITSSEGMKMHRADDGLNFSEETGDLPEGSDPSVIELGGGQMRMYYVTTQGENGRKEIKTARSSDGLNWTAEGSTGITNPTANNAWGVPDSFIDPEGKTRLFWVAMPTSAASLAVPTPIFSQARGGIQVGKIQPDASQPAVNFLNLSDAAWSQYDLIASTAYLSQENEIAVVVMDQASQVPFLTHSVSNNYTDHEALFGLADASLWSNYAVDTAADLDGDGQLEYVVRERSSGYTFLVYTESDANQIKATGSVLGLDPLALSNYRIEAGGDGDGDSGYADLFIRDLATRMLYIVFNDHSGGYGQIFPLFGFSAETWALYRIASAGDYDGDGKLDLVVQDSAGNASYKVFGISNNTFSAVEYIP